VTVTVPPLAPLGLVSLRLNNPRDLLSVFPSQWVLPEDRDLFDAAMRAATALARAAILFESDHTPLHAVANSAFVSEARAASAALMEVVGMPWPGIYDLDRAMPEAAYRDIAAGLELLADGMVPQPDVNNFLTNLTEAIATIPGRRITWTFAELPDFR
jgi:hypothetical protein